eukprot:200676-Chlamydomonas_euryale.AAC.3
MRAAGWAWFGCWRRANAQRSMRDHRPIRPRLVMFGCARTHDADGRVALHLLVHGLAQRLPQHHLLGRRLSDGAHRAATGGAACGAHGRARKRCSWWRCSKACRGKSVKERQDTAQGTAASRQGTNAARRACRAPRSHTINVTNPPRPALGRACPSSGRVAAPSCSVGPYLRTVPSG